MLENRCGGLFSLVNDQVRIRNGTDTMLLKNVPSPPLLHSQLQNTLPKYHCFDGSSGTANEFGVSHYAGKVNYDITGFVDKNRDRIFDSLWNKHNTLTS